MGGRRRLLFAFKGGRASRLAQIEAGGESPSEFLFGGVQLRRTHDVEVIESTAPSPQASLVDHAVNHLGARLLGIGVDVPGFIAHRPRLLSCDALVATPDSAALAFARLKRQRRAAAVPLVYLAMGLGACLERLSRRRLSTFRAWLSFHRRLLEECNAIVALGRGEHDVLRRLFPEAAGRIHFVPFGVDTTFWRPSPGPRERTFLFVGNDPNRHFDLVASIVRSRPDLHFRLVSSDGRLLRLDVPNAERVAGDWRRATLSDHEMRGLYQSCAAVFLPLRESLQPSGQSVALQALACGTPVLITRTAGFWEPDRWRDGEHVCFVEGAGVEEWSKALDALAGDEGLRSRMAEQGGALVRERYSIEGFADALRSIVDAVAAHG
jgi:glycosyltransferase involved in cell wall biosynthesis